MTARAHSYLEALMLAEDRPIALRPGEVLFRQGETASQMYIVREGTLELRLGRRLLESVGPGGVVGEMSLVDPAPRSASALAVSACSVVAIDEATFHNLVRAVPSLALEVMRIMARRLRRGNEPVRKASAAPARRRPAPKARPKARGARSSAPKKPARRA